MGYKELETKGVCVPSTPASSSLENPWKNNSPSNRKSSSGVISVGQEQDPGGGTVLLWPAKRGQLFLLTRFPKEVRQIHLSILFASVG